MSSSEEIIMVAQHLSIKEEDLCGGGGAVSIEQRVHMAWQWGCRVFGANDLSGLLLPAVGHSHTERRARKRGVVTGE